MTTKSAISLAALFLAGCATATVSNTAPVPAPVTGMFVTTLGTDTTQIERYTRTANRVEGDVLIRYPTPRMLHYAADIGANGRVTGTTVVATVPFPDTTKPAMMRGVISVGDTVSVVTVERNGRPDTLVRRTRIVRGPAMAVVGSTPPSIGLAEQLLLANPLTADSLGVYLIRTTPGVDQTLWIKRAGDNRYSLRNTQFEGWTDYATVDAQGRITIYDAAGTTVKTFSRRVDNLDWAGLATRWAAEATARRAPVQLSPPDTVRANINGANIEVDYSRPSKRGRVIFGSSIVPWGEVWRTGANAATIFSTSKDLIIGNVTLPAGKYTLWTIPSQTRPILIINSETGQWGTDYKKEKDFARVDLNSRTLTSPVEMFTIVVEPQGAGGVLRLRWDTTEYFVPFTVK